MIEVLIEASHPWGRKLVVGKYFSDFQSQATGGTGFAAVGSADTMKALFLFKNGIGSSGEILKHNVRLQP